MNSRTDHTTLLSALDPAGLAFVTEAYGVTAAPVKPTFKITSNITAKELMTPSAPPTGTKEVTKTPKPCYLPTQNTLSAAAFLVAMRQVGKRPSVHIQDTTDPITGEVYAAGSIHLNDKGAPILVHDDKMQIVDEQANIAAFCGYDLSVPHGTQLDNAHRLAHSALARTRRQESGVKVIHTAHRSPEAHQAKWSAAGYVAGVPNALRKLVADLEGRERLAVSDVCTFTNLRAAVTGNEREAYDKLLTKEFPSTTALRETRNENGDVVGYEKVEVKNPIAASLDGLTWRGEKLINVLGSLQALAEARLEAIRADKTGVDVDASKAHEFVMRLAEEEMAPIRAGEESEIDCIDRSGKSSKMTRYEARLINADRLVSLSIAAEDGDKLAQQECFEIACEHTRLALTRRGAPTIEEDVVLFGSVPKG